MRDLHNNITVKQALETIVVNNDTEGTGASVDLRGHNAAEMIVDVGLSGDVLSGSVFLELKLQHSDDGSAWTAVSDADFMLGATPDANGRFALIDDPAEDQVVVKVGYIGPKRFIRLFVDTTGTHTNGTPIGAVAVLGRERHAPAGAQAV
jgi:hypothetical protein